MVSCRALLVLATSVAAVSMPKVASGPWPGLYESVKAKAFVGLGDAFVCGAEFLWGDNYVVPVPGTNVVFTVDNYFQYMIGFLIAGLHNDNGVAMQRWYLEGTGLSEVTAGATRVGPGPKTITKMGFEDVKATGEAMSAKIEAGTLERRNELGMQYLAPTMWPEKPGGLPTIALGQSNENHAFFRPLIANALDNSLDEQGACDGSTCWNTAWLEQRAEAFFLNRNSLESDDLKWYVTQILHKVELNMDLTEAHARDFADYMGRMLTLLPLRDNVVKSHLARLALDPAATIAEKMWILEKYKAAILVKYAGADWINDDERVKLYASTNLDSLALAGGLSVPTVLMVAVGLTHMAESNKPASLRGGVAADEEWVLWETMRKYAPVAGVPYWEGTGIINMTHIIPNVAQALMDASVFPEPLEFKNRGLSFYHEKMKDTSGTNAGMGWAGPAIAADKKTANPHSHNCPGQDLSIKVMRTFLSALVKHGPWSAASPGDIAANANGISSYTLLKKGLTHTTGCVLFPSCREGYTWKETRRCGFPSRDWTCIVW